MIIKILCTALLFSFLSINGLAQASSLPDHVLPESSYPYWPEYNFKDFDEVKNIQAHPWQVSNHTINGWDWSLPETLVPAENGLIGMQRISNLHLAVDDRFLFKQTNAEFPVNSVGVLWIRWRDLEAVDGVIDLEPLKAKILDANKKGIQIVLRILAHSYSRNGDESQGDVPLWMADLDVDTLALEGINKNYDPSDPDFHERYLLLVKELGKKLDLLTGKRLAELHNDESYLLEGEVGEKKSIADLVKAAYVGYASKSLGDEGIGPHGEHNPQENDAEVHVQERLAAWQQAFNGIEHKVYMGGESNIGFDYGFGTRRGFVEMYLYRIPNVANEPNVLGQAIDDKGYIIVDETVPLIKNGAFHGEENEEYKANYAEE